MGENNVLWFIILVFSLGGAVGAFFFYRHQQTTLHKYSSNTIKYINVTVSPTGDGNFTLISEAILAAPSYNSARFVIRICSGVYNEVVLVPQEKKNIVLVGDGAEQTKVTASKHTPDVTTSETATFSVYGDGLMAEGITFENTAGDENEAQAVAVLCSANFTIFYKCNFIGYHDTLYAKEGKQFYRECDIYGTVDFIFGFALAVFQKCNLYARLPQYQKVTYTAQGRMSLDQQSGFTVQGCRITTAPEVGEASRSSVRGFLGRPWFPYSTVMVMESFLDSTVDSSGWESWSDSPPSSANYLEYKNIGPGAETSGRVQWPGFKVVHNAAEAMPYTASRLIQGDEWIPRSGIPYKGGFLS